MKGTVQQATAGTRVQCLMWIFKLRDEVCGTYAGQCALVHSFEIAWLLNLQIKARAVHCANVACQCCRGFAGNKGSTQIAAFDLVSTLSRCALPLACKVAGLST